MNSITKYKKELTKRLLCSRKDREMLMGQFEGMLDDFLEETSSPSREQLEAAFGPPENMAETLLTGITAEDIDSYKKRHLIMHILVKVLVGIVLAASISLTVKLYLDSQTPVVTNDVIVIEGTEPVTETEDTK